MFKHIFRLLMHPLAPVNHQSVLLSVSYWSHVAFLVVSSCHPKWSVNFLFGLIEMWYLWMLFLFEDNYFWGSWWFNPGWRHPTKWVLSSFEMFGKGDIRRLFYVLFSWPADDDTIPHYYVFLQKMGHPLNPLGLSCCLQGFILWPLLSGKPTELRKRGKLTSC